jgi:hypothetical protein
MPRVCLAAACGDGGLVQGRRAVREGADRALGASDRICGKRLKPLIPTLVEAMERHGHLQLVSEVRIGLLSISAATIDRALRGVRVVAGGRPRRHTAPSGAVRHSVPVRTFTDWQDPLDRLL